jgi:uroporphyrinogen-III synthase
MSRPLAVLRPEPGNAATAAAIAARGYEAIRLPLFEVRPLPWTAPAPDAFDALLLTSANAVRHGGAALAALRTLPVHAVGEATAAAARAAGFEIRSVGHAGVEALLADAAAHGTRRALHLSGRERTVASHAILAAVIPVYASEQRDVAEGTIRGLTGSVALLHSARAARRLAALVDAAGVPRETLALAAISDAVLAAAGDGWGTQAVPRQVDPDALIDCAVALAD